MCGKPSSTCIHIFAFASLTHSLCKILINSSLLHSVTVLDFRTNTEAVIGWQSTYLYVHLNDATPVQQSNNGKKLSKEDECFAMAYQTVFPAKIHVQRGETFTAHTVKFAQPKFWRAILKNRRFSQTAVRWTHYTEDVVMPKWTNLYNHDLWTVWRIVPTTKSIPYLKIQAACLSQQLASLSQKSLSQQSTQKNKYQYVYQDHSNPNDSQIIEEEEQQQDTELPDDTDD